VPAAASFTTGGAWPQQSGSCRLAVRLGQQPSQQSFLQMHAIGGLPHDGALWLSITSSVTSSPRRRGGNA